MMNGLKILTWPVGRLELPFTKMESRGWGVNRRVDLRIRPEREGEALGVGRASRQRQWKWYF